MSAKRDYYDILGIGKNASPDEIKTAYRKLARKHHPDMNPEADKKEAEEKFKELSEAYEVLIDPQKKQLYDQYGHQGVDQQFGQGGFTWNNFTHFGDVEDIFGDLLGNLFGRGFSRESAGESIIDRLFGGGGASYSRSRRGSDLRVTIPLSLKEIATGISKKVKIRKQEKCEVCGGIGGKGFRTCPKCGGSGQIRQVSSSFFGQFVNITACPECRGNGKVISERCSKCGSSGRVESIATVAIKIPAGVSRGNYIPLRGQGNAGSNGGPPGDLIAVIDEREDELFERRDRDIFMRMPISFSVAALGGKVEVPTLDGKVAMRIPRGTQSGKVFKLRGKGLPSLNSYRKGDELVEVFVNVPEDLSPEAEEMIKKLDKLVK